MNPKARKKVLLLIGLAVIATVVCLLIWRPTKEAVAVRVGQPDYLIQAIGTDDYQKVKRYIESGGQINALSAHGGNQGIKVTVIGDDYTIHDDGNFPLAMAVNCLKPELVKYLLAHGADVRFKTRSGSTVLHLACRSLVSLPVMEMLLAKGTDINAVGPGGLTPLDFVDARNSEVLMLMLDKGALTGAKKLTFEEAKELEMPTGRPQLTPKSILAKDRRQLGSKQETLDDLLCRAARSAAFDTVKMLLERGANPNARDRLSGLVPIMNCISCYQKSFDSMREDRLPKYNDYCSKLVSLLIQNGADIRKAMNDKGQTALHVACMVHDSSLVKVLVKAGADRNAKDNAGRTPYSYLVAVEDEIR